MTNEELKKKIVEILEETEYEWTEEKNGYILQIFYDNLADALIAAGIVDKSDYASMKKTAVRYKAEVSKAGARVKEAEAEANRYEMLYKLQNRDMALAERRAHDAEHRAEVAERALKSALNDDTCYFCNMNVPCKVGRDWGSSECIKSLLQQAEKELAEEGKDD